MDMGRCKAISGRGGGKLKIQVKNLKKSFKKKIILSDIELSFSGVYGLLGPNGAGKTTLMKILAGLESFDSGQICLDDKLISSKSYVRKTAAIGYLPQEFMVYPDLTVHEVLKHIAVLQGIPVKDTSLKIKPVLEQVNLSQHRYKRMKELSGGMRRRVGIAQLLLRNPSILLFDEPTSGLDIEERVRFRNLLKQLGKNHTVIICSHLVEDIEFLCDHIGIIKNGNVLFEGSPIELKRMAGDYVYQLKINHEELDEVISTHEVVQLDDEGTHVLVRILSNEVHEKSVPPRLVDGYLTLLKGSHTYA